MWSCNDYSHVVYIRFYFFFFSSRRRHTRCALVTGVQTCALPISSDEKPRRLTRREDGCPAWIRTTIDGVRVRSLAVRRRGNKARDLGGGFPRVKGTIGRAARRLLRRMCDACCRIPFDDCHRPFKVVRSEEHTSELQSLMRISYAVFCLK